jgi:hypothetical protein
MDDGKKSGKLAGWTTFIRTANAGSRQLANHVDCGRALLGEEGALGLTRQARSRDHLMPSLT